ncbi:MAG TPA: DNA polymerase/3'-5' exonuclease PolX [Chloroflexota bacterium]|nr:DNA polymerase/3'-5' exonuclease PolX [Chloroflexota bacterium]
METANNRTIGDILDEIAELLELKGESSFRVRAYENAASTIRHLPEDIGVLAEAGRLKSIQGVGEALAVKIDEYLSTGSMGYLDELRSQFPPGVRRLMSIPGVGPKLAARAYRELGIESVDELKQAAEDGRLAALPRLGQRSAENVLRAIARSAGQEGERIPIGAALPYVREIMRRLEGTDVAANVCVAGSVRRFQDTIHDVDIIATSDDPDGVFDLVLTTPGIREVAARGPTKLSIVTTRGMQVDFRIVPHEAFGSLLQHFTGSKQHNVQLREYALKRGQSLSEYGIMDVESGQRTAFSDEQSFYAALDLPWIPPEIRQGTGEIEAAREGRLPKLVSVGDIRGDLHVHTDWSDGTASLEEMVRAAVTRGYSYLAITDHSPSRGGRPGGLSVDRLRRQAELIEEVQRRFPDIHLLRGTEVDIKNDGSLDFPDEVLARLDWVVASIHSTFSMPAPQMTERMLAAIRNPHVDAIGHPTGRVLGGRPPYEMDMEAVFQAARETGTVLEINSFPQRLDLKDSHVRRAIDLGVMLSVDTDAHSVAELGQMEFGIEVARRGWATPDSVLNTRSYEELRAALENRL